MVFSCTLLILLVCCAPAEAARGAVVLEAYSGAVLYEQMGEVPLPPASTTKILTALLCLDLSPDLEAEHSISARAAAIGESSMDLRTGESLTLHQLLQGALVHSSNDACYAIGEICAGSEPLFVHWMNMKAAVLGADTVQMCNTSGLPDEKHQMSAMDLACLTRYALRHALFREIVSGKSVEICSKDAYRYYRNTNKLLNYDDHIIGVKTGTTDAAGKCLVSAYRDGAAIYIAVVLNSADRYGESYDLLCRAAEEKLLLRYPCRGRVLCCVPCEKGYCRLQAERDLNVLLTEKETEGIRLCWSLKEGEGRLSLLDKDGILLEETALILTE